MCFGVGKGLCLWLVMGWIKIFSRGVHPSAYERICVPESRRTFAAEKEKNGSKKKEDKKGIKMGVKMEVKEEVKREVKRCAQDECNAMIKVSSFLTSASEAS